ncbi:rod shape-determining protein MreD [Halothiobacillus neapolitanus]|uniref:Rod shape-determining protein MreD n=1 Tax=Halothiobacillus neapolitanus (strain ATCC 23641 / DSM 15147 / CIP 104769 / NCIMB 8539 / c2) TaxID=555778 RepID=D0L063_HALNC|nr:rod shape-determining protein MreD [Halothiobacillus neapolitanus]ACX96086.1 rod shape-determining protein MreD [Halothiobacillus neapolitanus c2]TDN66393.1 rod shape-determining protein MreD [Halothiobacillus neapolitanus]
MRNKWAMIPLSLLVALILTVEPSVPLYQHYSPQWLLLTVLYWCIREPNSVGLIVAWMSGLVLDVASVGLLGANALLFTLSAAVVLGLRQMLFFTGPVQQALFVAGLSAIYLLLSLWMQGGISDLTMLLHNLVRVASNLVAWPIILMVFHLLRRRY